MSVKRSLPMDQAPAVIRTATKIVRKVGYPTQKILTPNLVITNSVDSCMFMNCYLIRIPFLCLWLFFMQ